MDKEQLLELITIEEVIDLMLSFGSRHPLRDHQGNYIFNTVCHNGAGQGSHKLWYYPESRSFFCFSECGAMNIIDLAMKMLNLTFKEAFNYLCQYKGISAYQGVEQRGFHRESFENEDLEFLNRHLSVVETKTVELTVYDDNVLQLFHLCYPEEWFKEGITPETAEVFDLRYCFNRNAVIIPYRNQEGELIGIRQRNFDEEQVAAGRKYIPATIEKTTYRYPTSQIFYGIYQNQEAIRQAKEVVLVEGEKSVLLYNSYYPNRSIALAMGGSSFSINHRETLLGLGVERVVICLDKDYHTEQLEDLTSSDYKAFKGMVRRLKKMVGLLAPYCQVSIVMCFDDRLGYKDSPLDQGKSVYESLLKEREIIDEASQLDDLLLF